MSTDNQPLAYTDEMNREYAQSEANAKRAETRLKNKLDREWQDIDKVSKAIEILDVLMNVYPQSLDDLPSGEYDYDNAEYGWELLKKRIQEFEEDSDE